jgi:hypothetical protein
MTRNNRYGEPWKREPSDKCRHRFLVEAVDNKGQYRPVIDDVGFLGEEDFDHMLACVNACAGLTNAELKRGVVPKEKDGG